MNDINDIAKQPPGFKPYFYHSTILHTEDADLNENQEVFISGVIIDRDYTGEHGEYIEISLYCKPGTFIYNIYPYADNLELTLIRLSQERSGGQLVKFEQRFKAVYLLDKNINLPTNATGPMDLMNKQPPLILTLQLVDRGAWALRNTVVQGAYSDLFSDKNKDMSASSIMKSVMSTAASRIKIDNKPILDRIDIEKAHNETPIKAITIPTGTELFKLPQFIQEKRGGVYNSGIGCYVQFYSATPYNPAERVLFVYSLYDGSKFDESDNQIMFFVPSTGKMQLSECSYKNHGGILKVVTGQVDGLESTKGAVFRSEGEGFRTARADAMMSAPLEFKEDGPRFKKTQVLTEVASKQQEDGITYAPYKGISNNHFVNTSEILSRSGEYMILMVTNLDPNMIYPGAACRIMYELGNGLIGELNGVIHKLTSRFEYFNFNPLDEAKTTRHALINKTAITVYVTGPKS